MNPGPAPRPPVDRPRLNLTPQTANLPGNMNSLSIASPITKTATSTYSGSTVPLPLARQISSSDNQGGVSIIKDGWAIVKDGNTFLKAWRSKYLILRKDSLDFHKEENGKVSYSIILKDVVGVSRVESAGIIFEIKRFLDGPSNSPGEDRDGIRSLQIKVKTDDELYQWVDFVYARCPGMGGVSNPTNFSHAIHVGFDSTTGKFVGLPPEWSKLLNSSAITKEDYERDPQAVFEVLEFYSDITKRAQEPETYPTPPAGSNQNKQLGYTSGGNSGGTNIAPPRLQPNNGTRNPSYGSAPTSSMPVSQQQQVEQMRQMAANFNPNAQREEQRKKELQAEKQRERERERERREQEERERRELETYNASLPKTRTPMAQQEIGGGGYSSASTDRYNPTRAAPPTPRSQAPQQQQQPGSLRAQRQAPQAPSSASTSRPGPSQQSSTSSQSMQSRDQNGRSSPRTEQQRSESPRYQNGSQIPQSASRAPTGTQQQSQGLPRMQPAAQPKPLNVNKAAPVQNGIQQNDAVKAAEAALTSKAPPRKDDVRMSTMSESDVMAKLKEVVSKDDPGLSYAKQKKIGQGASGSVYVAKVKENAVSPIAREVLRVQGPKAQVAIKQMDLAHQPRKELIVNEIMVMKDSKHPNIVNFLDAFLRNNYTELWVVMEFMEGGALTDVIDNNPNITEDQISTICLEVCFCS
jgi:hypothetical protein